MKQLALIVLAALSGGAGNASAPVPGRLRTLQGARLAIAAEAMEWVWDGARFRLTPLDRLEQCEGAARWPNLSRAAAVRC